MATTVTSKGQVTIPKEIRDLLGIEPGNALEFRINQAGDVVVEKLGGVRPTSRFEAVRGILGPSPSTDELMAMLRGDDP